MSTYPVRAAMVPMARTLRAYFAPVVRATETPAIFDPSVQGAFALDAPPAPWLDLGWVQGFNRSAATKVQAVPAGAKGAPGSAFREALSSTVDFEFREWGKLQMALAGGSQHMNVLASVSGSTPQPSGATPVAAVAVLAGSTASQLTVGVGAIASFNIGDLVAVEPDYAQQTGYVGTGIAAAYVKQATDVRNDANYVRRVTFNVARVSGKTTTALLLAQPLLGGAPAANAAAQKVVAFVDREGGSFFQEWSALFVWPEEAGGRICLYYPRLTPRGFAGTGFPAPQAGAKSAGKAGMVTTHGGSGGGGSRMSSGISSHGGGSGGFGGGGVSGHGEAPDPAVAVAPPLNARSLRASFLALPYTDINDNETVVCYRSYFPAASAAVY